jgi:hypothetical protein
MACLIIATRTKNYTTTMPSWLTILVTKWCIRINKIVAWTQSLPNAVDWPEKQRWSELWIFASPPLQSVHCGRNWVQATILVIRIHHLVTSIAFPRRLRFHKATELPRHLHLLLSHAGFVSPRLFSTQSARLCLVSGGICFSMIFIFRKATHPSLA